MSNLLLCFGCACAVFFLRRRLPLLLVTAVAIRVLIPDVASRAVLSGPIGLHPSTWLLLFSVLIVVARWARGFYANGHNERRGAVVLFGAVIGQAVVVIRSVDVSTLRGFLDTWGAAALLLIAIVLSAPEWSEQARSWSVRALALLGGLEGILASVQALTGQPLLFGDAYSTNYWYAPAVSARWFGTLDSPLDAALFLSLAAFYVYAFQSWIVRGLLIFALMSGQLSTQSRAGIVATAIGGLISLFGPSIRRGHVFGVAAAVVGLVCVPLVTWLIPAPSSALARFGDDDGSSAARAEAYSYLVNHGSWHLLYGGGYGSSFNLRTDGLLASSLENGYAMWALDFGLASAAGLIVALLLLSRVSDLFSPRYYLSAAAAFTVLFGALYSGLGTASAATTLTIFAAGACTFRGPTGLTRLAPQSFVVASAALKFGRS